MRRGVYLPVCWHTWLLPPADILPADTIGWVLAYTHISRGVYLPVGWHTWLLLFSGNFRQLIHYRQTLSAMCWSICSQPYCEGKQELLVSRVNNKTQAEFQVVYHVQVIPKEWLVLISRVVLWFHKLIYGVHTRTENGEKLTDYIINGNLYCCKKTIKQNIFETSVSIIITSHRFHICWANSVRGGFPSLTAKSAWCTFL